MPAKSESARSPTRLMATALALFLVAMTAVACGDTEEEPLVFGQGEMPSSIPDDFPIPVGARVGATLVDRTNIKTQVELRIGNTFEDVLRFYSVRLVDQGYVIDASHGDDTLWEIDFRKQDLLGSIVVQRQAPSVSLVVVEINEV